jgi:PII-like signaling protein
MDKDMMLARIYLREADPGHRKALLADILSVLHDEHRVHGVTVFRGIAGFGHQGDIHTADLLHLGVHLPLVVEFFDEPDIVAAAIEALGDLVPLEHLTQWAVRCRCG